ncbi:hypothetical protein DA077_01800 [Lactiplantibacillus paraplantarum]|uniref:Uncharacterized protein n=1 Tax=Lactiplantibacillus paraplantarum TaxID=60520 RepID=A0AAD0X714_9LACO|nr:hypothetical protein DA077_01800 [Lactiplantibacillus paraplantarum]AYJ37626.1 hypothetical protein LP667_01705 [Lactiplantibacillus paraplantarum]RKD29899.1 hypothetical protein BG617_01730 [Lactiplantibacillus paraplantarum]GEO60793.1 hypothetical protein LPA07_11140 [Lactiplantibacillus paraplantarum]
MIWTQTVVLFINCLLYFNCKFVIYYPFFENQKIIVAIIPFRLTVHVFTKNNIDKNNINLGTELVGVCLEFFSAIFA